MKKTLTNLAEASRQAKATMEEFEKLAAAGHGSTANTCAIIRTHYSTLDGTALAYDGYFYWKKWGDYVGDTDELGPAKFYDIGVLVIKPESFDLSKAVEGALYLIDRQLHSHGIKPEIYLDDSGLPVKGTLVHVEQIIINLTVNAMHILDKIDRSDKTIKISTYKKKKL